MSLGKQERRHKSDAQLDISIIKETQTTYNCGKNHGVKRGRTLEDRMLTFDRDSVLLACHSVSRLQQEFQIR